MQPHRAARPATVCHSLTMGCKKTRPRRQPTFVAGESRARKIPRKLRPRRRRLKDLVEISAVSRSISRLSTFSITGDEFTARGFLPSTARGPNLAPQGRTRSVAVHGAAVRQGAAAARQTSVIVNRPNVRYSPSDVYRLSRARRAPDTAAYGANRRRAHTQLRKGIWGNETNPASAAK
jgi:hypothetical protein